ncbi:MAG: DNA primase [bacterium]
MDLKELISKIKKNINYIEFYSKFMKLKKVGSTYMAICPFHMDSNPSLSIDINDGLWYCFGCNRGGDIFNFIMEYEDLNFIESAKYLSEYLNIEFNDFIQENQETENKEKITIAKEKINQLYKLFSEYYNKVLLKTTVGQKALEYLKNRGINKELIETFLIGYCPKNIENTLTFINKKKLNIKDLINISLIIEKGKNKYHEIMSGRITFPIFKSNKVIGISGRAIDNKTEPKYLNTIGLQKNSTLYALNITKNYIKSENKAIITEGYFDALSIYKTGFKNVVAIMGTNISSEQLNLLKKYCNRVLLVLDQDKSGIEATLKLLLLFISNNFLVEITTFKDYKDPNEILINNEEKLKEIISNPIDSFDFIINIYKSQKTQDKQNFLEKYIIPYISSISILLIFEEYLKKLSNVSKIDISYLKKLIKNYKSYQNKSNQNIKTEEKNLNLEKFVINEYGEKIFILSLFFYKFEIFLKILKEQEFLIQEIFKNLNETEKILYEHLIQSKENNKLPNTYILYELKLEEIIRVIAKIISKTNNQNLYEYSLNILKNIYNKSIFEQIKEALKNNDLNKAKELQNKILKN